MKLRKWIADGLQENGKPKVIYTSPEAKREIAYKKLCYLVPEKYRFCIKLIRGEVEEI